MHSGTGPYWLNVRDAVKTSAIVPANFTAKIRQCNPGERQDTAERRCKQCLPGQFSNVTSAPACLTCLNGTYASTSGLAKVSSCFSLTVTAVLPLLRPSVVMPALEYVLMVKLCRSKLHCLLAST